MINAWLVSRLGLAMLWMLGMLEPGGCSAVEEAFEALKHEAHALTEDQMVRRLSALRAMRTVTSLAKPWGGGADGGVLKPPHA